MNLAKQSETSTTITLVWTPPANVGGYTLYSAGQVVSIASANLKGGSPRSSAKFHKTSPGPPFEVVAVCRSATGAFTLDVGKYPGATQPPPSTVYPSTSRYPSEALA